MKLLITIAAGSLLLSTAAAAQEGNWMVPAPERKAAKPVAAAGTPLIRAGTEVPLALGEAMQGKTLQAGQRFQVKVDADVQGLSGIAIPAGSLVEAEVTQVSGKGKAAKVTGRLLYVRVGTKLMRVTGTFEGTAAAAAAKLSEDVKVAMK